MSSIAKQNFDQNKQDVASLWAIHQEIAGAGPGRKRDVEVINRSAMIFITACWESYIEDVAKESFEFILQHMTGAQSVPAKLKAFVAAPYLEQKDPRKVWELADSGWKTILIGRKNEILNEWLGHFNTPKTAQIDQLFEELLGLKRLSNCWHWQRVNNEAAKKKLDDYVTIRGNIAHRIRHSGAVYKNWGIGYLRHTEGLVHCTDQKMREYVNGLVGTYPWPV